MEAELLEGFREAFGGLLAGAACCHRLMPHPDAASQKGAGGEDHGCGAVGAAEIGADTGDALLSAVATHLKASDHRFAQGQVGGVLQQLQHLAGVEAFVGLGAQGPDSGSAAGVEDAFLDRCGIGQATDHATEGIDFVDQLALGRSAHGGIARLPGDSVEIEGEQGRVQPQPCSGDRGLTAGVTTSHDDHVEDFARGRGEAHGFIIRSYGSGSDPPGVLLRCSVS